MIWILSCDIAIYAATFVPNTVSPPSCCIAGNNRCYNTAADDCTDFGDTFVPSETCGGSQCCADPTQYPGCELKVRIKGRIDPLPLCAPRSPRSHCDIITTIRSLFVSVAGFLTPLCCCFQPEESQVDDSCKCEISGRPCCFGLTGVFAA